MDTLAAAWRLVAARLPEARLHLVGSGTQADVAAALERAGARWDRALGTDELARALDSARVLVLPSAAEGLGRVILEAFLRARPVVASRVGGIRDLVEHGVNGLLVEPGDAEALAAALECVLRDRELASRLGQAAHGTGAAWLTTADEFADNVRAVVDSVL